MNRTIVVVGVFGEGSSNNGIVRAFEDLGYDVKKVPYRELAHDIGVVAASWGIKNIVETFKPYLTVFCKFNGFPSDVISVCNPHTLTCLWFMDSYDTLRESCPEIIQHCHNSTFSIHWPGVADELEAIGVPNVYGLVEGCDPNEFHSIQPVDKYRADISFIGTKNHRHGYIEMLREAGFVVKCYGHGYDEVVTGDEFNAVCSSSKMVLNIPTYPGLREYFGDRIVRTLATRTISLTMYVPGMENHFSNGKDLVWFEDGDECVKVAKKYIENSDIADNGYNLFINNYTCAHFVQKMLDIAGGYNNE